MSIPEKFEGTAIKKWNSTTRQHDEVEITSLSNEDLLDEYGAEEESSSRAISTDPPSPIDKLREEILRRMSHA